MQPDGSNGHHVLADKYDRNMNDIFDVQDAIVQKIYSVVALELDKAEVRRSSDKQVNNMSSLDLCLKSKAQLDCHTRADNLKALKLFLRGINIRADYSKSYSGVDQSAITRGTTSSWAHHRLSTAYQWLDRLDHALDKIKAAVELNPNDLYTLHALGNKSDLAGDTNGIKSMEQAQNLNLEHTQSHTHLVYLARTYIAVGDFQQQVIVRAKPITQLLIT